MKKLFIFAFCIVTVFAASITAFATGDVVTWVNNAKSTISQVVSSLIGIAGMWWAFQKFLKRDMLGGFVIIIAGMLLILLISDSGFVREIGDSIIKSIKGS